MIKLKLASGLDRRRRLYTFPIPHYLYYSIKSRKLFSEGAANDIKALVGADDESLIL